MIETSNAGPRAISKDSLNIPYSSQPAEIPGNSSQFLIPQSTISPAICLSSGVNVDASPRSSCSTQLIYTVSSTITTTVQHNDVPRSSTALRAGQVQSPPPLIPPVSNVAPSQSRHISQDYEGNTDVVLLNRELATAKARIAQLDAEIDDRNRRINILTSKVNTLEEKVN